LGKVVKGMRGNPEPAEHFVNISGFVDYFDCIVCFIWWVYEIWAFFGLP